MNHRKQSYFKNVFGNSLLFITARTTHGHLGVMTTLLPVHRKVAHLLNAEITHPVKEKLSEDTDELAWFSFFSLLLFMAKKNSNLRI